MGTAKEKSQKGSNMIVISRGYAFLLSGFILFLFFWMFVLGVFVGKGIIPGAMFDIKQPINRVRTLFGLKEKIKYEPPKEGSLDFYADLENKKRRQRATTLLMPKIRSLISRSPFHGMKGRPGLIRVTR